MLENITAIKWLIVIATIIVGYNSIKNLLSDEEVEESARTFKQQDWKINRFRAKHILEKRKNK